MAKLRAINTKFWDDSYVITLEKEEILLFLYFLTNPLTNIAGIYEISIRRMSFDTRMSEKEVKTTLSKLEKDSKIYYIDGWLIIRNFAKHQSFNEKSNIAKGISNILNDLPKNIKDHIEKLKLSFSCDNFSKPKQSKKPDNAEVSNLEFHLKKIGGEDRLTLWTEVAKQIGMRETLRILINVNESRTAKNKMACAIGLAKQAGYKFNN